MDSKPGLSLSSQMNQQANFSFDSLYNGIMEQTSPLVRKISEIEAELLNLDHRRSEVLEVFAQL